MYTVWCLRYNVHNAMHGQFFTQKHSLRGSPLSKLCSSAQQKKSTPDDLVRENKQRYIEESVRGILGTGPERVQSGNSNLSKQTRMHRRAGRGGCNRKKAVEDLSRSVRHEAGSPGSENLRWASQIIVKLQVTRGWGPVSALLNTGSKVNAISLPYAKQLRLAIRPTNVGAQKIDGSSLATHGMTEILFSISERRSGSIPSVRLEVRLSA